ncbi:hypothetical protein [Hydrogenimonas sp.]
MVNKALRKAKRDTDTKVSVTFQVNSELKKEFERFCKEEGVSMTAMLVALMETALEEKKHGDLYSEVAAFLKSTIAEYQTSIAELEQEGLGRQPEIDEAYQKMLKDVKHLENLLSFFEE